MRCSYVLAPAVKCRVSVDNFHYLESNDANFFRSLFASVHFEALSLSLYEKNISLMFFFGVHIIRVNFFWIFSIYEIDRFCLIE